jgi:SAM-dependent methyltransferase
MSVASRMEYGPQHAAVFDAAFHSRGKDYPREAGAIVEMVRDRYPGARTLLDVACGTGLHLEIFARDFDHVEGVDLSPDMLAIARQRLPGVPLSAGDMRTFDVGRTFDAVTCMSNAVAEMQTLDELAAAMRRMAAHLVPGGVLVVEPWYFPESYLEGYVGGHLFRDGDRVVSRVTHSTRDGDLARHTVAFTVAEPTGITQFTEVCVLGMFTRDEYVDALEQAGVTAELVDPGFCLGDGRPNGPGVFVGTRA